MGTNNPHASTHITLTFEQGLAQRHGSLRECVASGVYRIGLGRVAGMTNMSSSKLSEKLTGGTDRKRDLGCDELEKYIAQTKDYSPIYYLIERFLQDPQVAQQQALATLASMSEQIPALLSAMGYQAKGKL
jgi:hypothetical protein